jgi:hypothetical protein
MPVKLTGPIPTVQELADLYGVPSRRVKQIVRFVDSRHQRTSKRAGALRKRNTRAKASKRAS